MIGLGLMGGTLATHLLTDGHPVTGYDPNEQRRNEHAGRGGVAVTSIGDAVAACSLAVLSLPNSGVTIEVCREIAEAAPPELLVIDTTTGDPADSITAAGMLADVGVGYVDATVSGNAAQAAARDIIFMVGGADADVARAAALLNPLGRHVYRVGPVGAGMRAKIVVNHVLSINRAAVAEALAVAEKAELELDSMFEVLRDSAAYSRAMDIWGQRMIDGDFDPPASRARQSLKDSRLINAHAESIGASHALVEAVRDALDEAVDNGLADADNASVMEVMRRRAGIGRC